MSRNDGPRIRILHFYMHKRWRLDISDRSIRQANSGEKQANVVDIASRRGQSERNLPFPKIEQIARDGDQHLKRSWHHVWLVLILFTQIVSVAKLTTEGGGEGFAILNWISVFNYFKSTSCWDKGQLISAVDLREDESCRVGRFVFGLDRELVKHTVSPSLKPVDESGGYTNKPPLAPDEWVGPRAACTSTTCPFQAQ